MKNSKRFLSLLILFLTVAMFSIVTVTASEVCRPQKYMPDNSIQIEEKYKKTSTHKVNFNANGGKIGSKKTIAINIKKGSKIKKLPSTPKRTGYTFKGWYSKKSGGTKISESTKPTKSVTYYAQWKKGSTSTDSKLLGRWQFRGLRDFNAPPSFSHYYYDYYFYKDGTFKYFYKSPRWSQLNQMYITTVTMTEGKYKANKDKIYFTNIVYGRGTEYETRYKDTVFEYKFGKDTVGEYLFMPQFQYDTSYLDISLGIKFRKK